MALKDKLMTLEDFKTVRDVDVASNSAQFTEIKADLGDYLSLESDDAVAIPANSNLDDYTEAGNYKVVSISVADTITNIPYETSGRLIVLKTTQNDRILQIYWCNSKLTYGIYFRMNIDGWGNWLKCVNFADLNDLSTTLTSNTNSAVALLTNYTAFSFNVYSADTVPIQIKTEGENVIVILPAKIYVEYITRTGTYSYDTVAAPGTYTLKDGEYLVEQNMDKSISVKTFAQLRELDKTARYNILCFNSRGIPLGILTQYIDSKLPYYNSKLTEWSNTVNANKARFGLNGISFYFTTDQHWKQNAQKSIYLIKKLRENTGIDLLINGGDIITKETTKALAYTKISNFISELESTGCAVYSCIGNHEFNNPNMSQDSADLAITLSLEEVCSVLYDRQIYNNAVFDSVSGCYYIDIKKTRIFVLQCNYGSNVYLTATRWVLEQMAQIPNGYNVILFSHVIVEWDADISSSVPKDRVQAVLNAMDAIKTKSSVTYEGRTYDYSALTNVTPVSVFGGHAHIDYAFYTTEGIPVILTTCDSDIQESGGLTRTRNTVTEQAFDVVTIDFTNRSIKLTRIGAGSDRSFTY